MGLAPTSMGFLGTLELIQLVYGERVFECFFSTECIPTGWKSSKPYVLTPFQRARAILSVFASIQIIIFLSIQVHFGWCHVFGTGVRLKSNKEALISFYCEVTALVNIFTLPALAGCEVLEI